MAGQVAIRKQIRANKSVCGSLIPSPTSLFLIFSITISLMMNGFFPPLTKRGFFCNDTTIRYPIRSDTVSFKALLVVALFIPSIVISFLERKLAKGLGNCEYKNGIRIRKNSDNLHDNKEEVEELMSTKTSDQIKRRMVINDDDDLDIEAIGPSIIDCDNKEYQNTNETSSASFHSEKETTNSVDNESEVRFVKSKGKTRNPLFKFSHLQLFLFGFMATAFLTGIGKTTSGRLRPHFIARCKPDIDCELSTNAYRYIEDFNCTDQTMRPREYTYITTSWPSGHASIIFFSMFYLIFFINFVTSVIVGSTKTTDKIRDVKCNPMLTYGIYVLMIGVATYISLTRVSDYHHHPLDVFSGGLLGSITAIVMSKYIMGPKFETVQPIKSLS